MDRATLNQAKNELELLPPHHSGAIASPCKRLGNDNMHILEWWPGGLGETRLIALSLAHMLPRSLSSDAGQKVDQQLLIIKGAGVVCVI